MDTVIGWKVGHCGMTLDCPFFRIGVGSPTQNIVGTVLVSKIICINKQIWSTIRELLLFIWEAPILSIHKDCLHFRQVMAAMKILVSLRNHWLDVHSKILSIHAWL